MKIAAQPFQTFGASPFANCRCFRLCRQNSTWQLEFVGLLTWTHDSRLTCRRWSSSHFGNFKFHTFFAVLAVVSRSWRVLAQIRQTKFIFSFIITTIDSQRANKNSESFGSATASHQSCELLSIVPAIVLVKNSHPLVGQHVPWIWTFSTFRVVRIRRVRFVQRNVTRNIAAHGHKRPAQIATAPLNRSQPIKNLQHKNEFRLSL